MKRSKQVGIVLIGESRGFCGFICAIGSKFTVFPIQKGISSGFIYPRNKDSLLKVG